MLVMTGRPRTVYLEVNSCGVCGEESHNRHFGGPACESCRAFFRRAVKKHTNYKLCASKSGLCTITRANRNVCKKCRYEKCLRIGMNPKLVDRRVIHAIINRQNKPDDIERIYNPDIRQFKNRLTDEEYTSVIGLVVAFTNVASQLPHETIAKEIVNRFPDAEIDIVNHLAICLGTKSRATRFALLLPDFQGLHPHDRDSLLWSNMIQISYLRKYYGFDHRQLTWPSDRVVESRRGSPAPVSIYRWTAFLTQNLIALRKNFISKLQELDIDEPTIMLLLVIVLLSPDTPGLIDAHKVETVQERYLSILHKYVQWRYGMTSTSIVYPKVLSVLTDLRELGERTEGNTYPHNNIELVSIYTKLANWCPFSIPSSDGVSFHDPNKCHNTCGSSDHQESGEKDLFNLLDSLDGVATEPDLEDIIKTEELLHPLFLNVPDVDCDTYAKIQTI